MKSIRGISISCMVMLSMGGCGLILDVDAGEYRPIDLACQAGQLECKGSTPRTCVDGGWQELSPCVGQTCIDGQCRGDCEAGAKQCVGNSTQRCDASGHFVDGLACMGQTCVNGECIGECLAGSKDCSGNSPRSCDENGQWVVSAACSSPKELCFEGGCIVAPPSCMGLPATCGPKGDESCCALTSVPGGTYNRSNDPMYPATVSDFGLDRFEITVGRFRKFVEAYSGSRPVAGAGAHPLIAGSGWDAAWDSELAPDKAGLIAKVKCNGPYDMWTDTPGANENKPMNCLNWFEAFAFCAWDGGRLPTEAEWNYAAAGGDQQRQYPWSNPPSSAIIDASYATYNCLGDSLPVCSVIDEDILEVGSKSPKGDGRWDQADLGGGMAEWNMDWYADPYPNGICTNCANLSSGSFREVRGGDWSNSASPLLSSVRGYVGPALHFGNIGGRCARSP